MESQPDKLRALLEQDRLHVMPCCFDALSAKMIAQAGFPLTFMSGFAVSASRIGQPDTGLISYGEIVDSGRNICAAVSIPVIGDGDTGYGNALNVRRTVEGYARAGFAAVMIEDQLAPKRCGHTRGKAVVGREEAYDRIKAAVDQRSGWQQHPDPGAHRRLEDPRPRGGLGAGPALLGPGGGYAVRRGAGGRGPDA